MEASNSNGLIFKWLKSENGSSKETKELARKTRIAFGMTPREYRKMLSYGRKKINVLERLMSLNEWDKIDFAHIPSVAGFKYIRTFFNRDETSQRYKEFMEDKDNTVRADVLYPANVIHKALSVSNPWMSPSEAEVLNISIEKYWDNLKDFFNGCTFNGIAVVDTSSSMSFTSIGGIEPIDVAISLGMYCATKCNPNSPFYNHYITFSRNARLVEIEGINFVDKVRKIYDTNLCENTNIKSVFDLILRTACMNRLPQSELPKNVIIISDMEFDSCAYFKDRIPHNYQSEMEKIKDKFEEYGYKMPHLTFWNVDARQNNIPMKVQDGVSFVSGYSPSILEAVLKEKNAIELMLDVLLDEMYEEIH